MMEETSTPKLGKFKPKRKYLNFVKGLKGKVRLLNNESYIKGDKLSGMLTGTKFKLTICDEGTIDFEELDTNLSNPEMIQRFIDDFDQMEVTGYVQKFVIDKLEFFDEDGNTCYLEVEHTKPIDKMFSIFDEKENKTISKTGLSILDSLFSSDKVEDTQVEITKEENSTKKRAKKTKTDSQSYLEEQFKKMNEEKVKELSIRIESKELEYSKSQFEIDRLEKKLDQISEDLNLLNTRLRSLLPKDEPIGWDFFVSQETKTGIEPDENLVKVVEQISPILKLKKDVVIDILTKGYYTIKIQKQEGSETELKVAIGKLSSIDIDGSIEMGEKNEFIYRGNFTWHQIVDAMIRKGFEQNPGFDKICGSNSYDSEKVEEK